VNQVRDQVKAKVNYLKDDVPNCDYWTRERIALEDDIKWLTQMLSYSIEIEKGRIFSDKFCSNGHPAKLSKMK
jgi:hypothetical protein